MESDGGDLELQALCGEAVGEFVEYEGGEEEDDVGGDGGWGPMWDVFLEVARSLVDEEGGDEQPGGVAEAVSGVLWRMRAGSGRGLGGGLGRFCGNGVFRGFPVPGGVARCCGASAGVLRPLGAFWRCCGAFPLGVGTVDFTLLEVCGLWAAR